MKDTLSKDEKYSFLVMILKKKIKDKLEEMTNISIGIEEDPKGCGLKLCEGKNELDILFVQLNYVGKDDEDNINGIFVKYEKEYDIFLKYFGKITKS